MLYARFYSWLPIFNGVKVLFYGPNLALAEL